MSQEVEDVMKNVGDRYSLVHVREMWHTRHYIASPKGVVWISYSVMNLHSYIRIRVRWLYMGIVNIFRINVNT